MMFKLYTFNDAKQFFKINTFNILEHLLNVTKFWNTSLARTLMVLKLSIFFFGIPTNTFSCRKIALKVLRDEFYADYTFLLRKFLVFYVNA